MLTANALAGRTEYPEELQTLLSMADALACRQWLSHWPALSAGPTPLYDLPDLARALGVGRIAVKDESVRSLVGSFKALGAPIALARLLVRRFAGRQLTAAGLFAGTCRQLAGTVTVISATDGNHGRALAAAARDIGCPCVIVLHGGVSREREEAIAAYGARIIRIIGNYDDSVAEAARLAAEHGWQVVSDTSYDGYEEVPRDVMQGYAVIAAEVTEQSESQPADPAFSHVLLQGGVGGFAAGVASYLWHYHGKHRPQLLVVEPREADCLFQSCLAGKPARASGTTDSLMAGLACGECSPLAWQFLQPTVDHFLAIGDQHVAGAMRLLALGSGRDIPIVAGESGAAGLAGLLTLTDQPSWRRATLLDRRSRVLLINTEGATSPAIYRQLAGTEADSVLARQQAWQAARP